MTSEQFCYWLQGRAEMQPDNPPSLEEWQMIREHLSTVFVKITPHLGSPATWAPTSPSIVSPLLQPLRTECIATC